jgi:hypothetical protein
VSGDGARLVESAGMEQPADVAPATGSRPMTRRSMIKALVSATSALVAGASAPSIAAGDVELIRLGAEFDVVTCAYDQLTVELKLLDAQYGIRADELAEDYRCGRIRGSEFSHKISDIQEIIETMTAMFDQQHTIANVVDSILRRILTSRATTPAGLAVKALARRFACSHFHELPDNAADLDVLHARSPIEAALWFAQAADRSGGVTL